MIGTISMPERRILVADADPKAADEIRQLLGAAWNVVGVATGPGALFQMQKQVCDVIVADLDLPELNGAEVLDLIRIAHPRAIRFLAATEVQKQRAMCHVAGGNQFLPKPFDTATLKATVERCLAADQGIINNSMRELIGRIRSFPTIPSLYLEVVSALSNPTATTAEVGGIVAKDMAMTTQLLQMLNSAYFSFPRTISDPAEAVGLLGFETVKSLVMSVKLRSQYDKIKPVYFSIDNVWRHSTNVAHLAKQLADLETGDNAMAAAAFTAGLLHDLGKIILAANFDSQYSGAHAIARKNQLQLCEVESDIFGANHGQIAAYLFSLWGMLPGVIDAASLHHHPYRCAERTFNALTAVHVANALDHESNADPDDLPIPLLDMSYLEELGLTHRVPEWRRALGMATTTEPEATAAPVKSVPKPNAPEPVQPSGQVLPPWGLRQWLLTGLGVAAAVALLCGVEVQRLKNASLEEDQSQAAETVAPKAAASIAPAPTVAAVAHKPAVTPPAVPSSPPKPAPAPVMVVAAAAPQAPVTPPAQASVAPTNAVAAPKAVAVTNALAAANPSPPASALVAAADSDEKTLKLEGIFYSASHPSAIINGNLMYVKQQKAGLRVLDISPTSVTVEYDNQRKILTMR